MKHLIAAFCLAVPLAAMSLPAEAQSRPLTRNMTCAAAQQLVSREGGIVLNTDQYIYDRYVSDMRFCPDRQATKPAWAPTRDNPQCFIGYTCVEADLDWW